MQRRDQEEDSWTSSSNGGPKDQDPLTTWRAHQSCLDGGVVQGIKGLPRAKPHNPAN